MIKLNKPQIKQKDIVDDCIDNMRESIKQKRLSESKNEIITVSEQYDILAESGSLLKMASKEKTESGASKEDLIYLYNNKFAKKGQLARKYYDEIILSAPNGKCPQCGLRQVKTLDHYLPKSKYPLLAITPYNLIPCCSDCNRDKLDGLFNSREKETMHPYYDDFDDEVWLKATLIEEDPLAFNFFVFKPDIWTKLKYDRAQNHFEVFKPNDLYKAWAVDSIITDLGGIYRLFQNCGEEIAREEISYRILDVRKLNKNAWKAAYYEAINISEWFWKQYLPNYRINL